MRTQFCNLETIHIKYIARQLLAAEHLLIYSFNVETTEIFSCNHLIWVNSNKADWTKLQRGILHLVPFIPLLFLDVFRVSVLEDTTFIMMPMGNRFCLYSFMMFFWGLSMKGTKEALTVWHCFYCFSLLYKQKMYFNFSCVSTLINPSGFRHTEPLSTDLYLGAKNFQASTGENSTHWKKTER